MNILIISRGYPCKGDPIYGIFESDQAKALVKLGHKVVVLCIDCLLYTSDAADEL